MTEASADSAALPAHGARAGGLGLTPSRARARGGDAVVLSILVFIPLIAVVVTATENGWSGFWRAITNEQTAAAIRLTVGSAVLVTIVNVVMGTAIAWVLVRDQFVGKPALEVLIDLPFALPTIVAGLVLLSLYGPESPLGVNIANTRPAVFLAFLFVTLPFVVRTVQPVLAELDRDAEEAAASLGASRLTTFRRIVLPALTPAIAAGAALSFARAVSEYGSLVLLSGNLPLRTEVTSVRTAQQHRERQPGRRRRGGHGPAGDLAGRDRRAQRHPASGGPAWLKLDAIWRRRLASRAPMAVTSAPRRPIGCAIAAGRICSVRGHRVSLHAGRLAGGARREEHVRRRLHRPEQHPQRPRRAPRADLTVRVAIISVVINTVFGVGMSILLVRYEFPGKRTAERLRWTCRCRCRPSSSVSRSCWSTAAGTAGSDRRSSPPAFQVIFSTPGIVLATVFVVASAHDPRSRACARGGRRRAGAGRVTASARARSRRSVESPCPRSGGRSSTASCSRSPGRSASSAR